MLVKGERCLRVVGHVKVQFLSYFALNTCLDFLVEIEDVIIARALSKGWVGNILMLKTEKQLRTSLHLQLNATGTEHFICRTDVELHIGDVEFLLIVMLYLTDLLLPVLMHDLTLRVFVILVLRQHIRRCDIGVTHLRADDIRAVFGLVFNGGTDIARVVKV